MSNTELAAGQRRRIWLTVLGLLLLIGIILGGFVNKISKPRVMTPSEMKINGAYMFETPRDFGDFALVDHNGNSFTRENLKGHWTLVFFGFTYCPDVCPATMAQLAQLMTRLDGLPEQADTEVVMVSVDPARDTPEKLASYVPYFNSEFIGLTGEFMDIHRFATALNTPFRKVPGQGEDYLVDHSANVVLINPMGDYHGFFKAPLDLAKLKVTYRSARAVWDFQH